LLAKPENALFASKTGIFGGMAGRFSGPFARDARSGTDGFRLPANGERRTKTPGLPGLPVNGNAAALDVVAVPVAGGR